MITWSKFLWKTSNICFYFTDINFKIELSTTLSFMTAYLRFISKKNIKNNFFPWSKFGRVLLLVLPQEMKKFLKIIFLKSSFFMQFFDFMIFRHSKPSLKLSKYISDALFDRLAPKWQWKIFFKIFQFFKIFAVFFSKTFKDKNSNLRCSKGQIHK